MTREQLEAQVTFELESLHAVVGEIDALLSEVGGTTPGVRVSTLVGAFMQ